MTEEQKSGEGEGISKRGQQLGRGGDYERGVHEDIVKPNFVCYSLKLTENKGEKGHFPPSQLQSSCRGLATPSPHCAHFLGEGVGWIPGDSTVTHPLLLCISLIFIPALINVSCQG